MKRIVIAGISVLILLGALTIAYQRYQTQKSSWQQTTVSIDAQKKNLNIFIYDGQDGKDALSLLKEKAQVQQDRSGLVTSINGRQANSAKKEYWAFYINGNLAQVGPASYQTKKGDTITWKIMHY